LQDRRLPAEDHRGCWIETLVPRANECGAAARRLKHGSAWPLDAGHPRVKFLALIRDTIYTGILPEKSDELKILTLIVLALLLLAPVIFTVVLFVAIIFNVRTGLRYREGLARKLGRLRLNKMLGALGIDTNTYLHGERVTDIYGDMERCANCRQARKCDQEIARGALKPGEIGFCDNEAPLREIVDHGGRNAAIRG